MGFDAAVNSAVGRRLRCRREGLALARDTARSLGGDLKLEFGTLGGASFLLTIPKS